MQVPLLPVLFSFFLSCHDLDDRFIRLTHSLLCKLSNITDRVFYTFFYKSVSAIELLSIFSASEVPEALLLQLMRFFAARLPSLHHTQHLS